MTLFAKLFLLATVSINPFPTRLLATYAAGRADDAHTVAAVYSATLLAMGIAFAVPLAFELRGMSRQRLDWLPTISGALVPPSGAPELPST